MARELEDWVTQGPCGNPKLQIPRFRVKNRNLKANALVKYPIDLKSASVIQKLYQSVSPNGHQAQSWGRTNLTNRVILAKSE